MGRAQRWKELGQEGDIRKEGQKGRSRGGKREGIRDREQGEGEKVDEELPGSCGWARQLPKCLGQAPLSSVGPCGSLIPPHSRGERWGTRSCWAIAGPSRGSMGSIEAGEQLLGPLALPSCSWLAAPLPPWGAAGPPWDPGGTSRGRCRLTEGNLGQQTSN